MKHVLALSLLAGILPLAAGGETARAPLPAPAAAVTNPVPLGLCLKVTCRNGAIVNLTRAALMEKALRKDGSIPPTVEGAPPASVRLDMPDGGTVAIPWQKILKIAVGERENSEKIYPVEITLRNVKGVKTGKTYGDDNTLVGQSDLGEFTIPLREVTEIVTLPEPTGT